MNQLISRRTVLGWIPLSVAAVTFLGLPRTGRSQEPSRDSLTDHLPSRDPKLAADTVLFAHFNIEKVAALLKSHPNLANAAVDWGFGDWETAIGAASHMGLPDMADLLLKNGARPDLFTHAMMGHIDVIRQIVRAQPGIQGTLGPHGLTLLHHARAGKEKATDVVSFLESVGGANPVPNIVDLLLPVSAYVGEYRFGPSSEAIMTVSTKKDKLRLKFAKGFSRVIHHTGNHHFYPVGSPSVSVTFKIEGDKAVEFSIIDGSPMLKAVRIA